ncbi:G-type lectin S-receptor-like serine/threonine-protein kinase SD2-5 [Rhododendron vialii]|uniref:G-type lectin S-receptor-like serine/threonine-protein kinase SD2-5 n=1 Tax=Rhododendron vialii TaxID=182163 RepID=UPI00265F760B|nr:G-type lectin S-receptor-like serine/threonine-protein kinase SD2-5 [Rhododendron vialii]
MAKPSLPLIISFAITITVFINSDYSAHLCNSQSVANLSTTWINNNPTIIMNSSFLFPGYQMTPVLSLSDTSQFVSGFYCFSKETTSCFFGIFIFGERKYSYFETQNSTILIEPQPVWFANRDHPVEVNATLKLTGNGDLILDDADGDMVWSTDTGGKSVTGLRFTKFGNLILFDSNNATVWQSFDHPMDSLLIGQKLVSNSGQKLIARASSSNFSRGIYSLSVQNGYLFICMEANPPVVYYKSTLEANPNSINSEKAYVVFENGSFNGQNFALRLTAQFMRLEPDGHLKVYEWGGGEWKTVVDLLTSEFFGDCGYPMVCGKYGICSSNGQCSCFAGSSNETEIFKQINYKQTNLGCSLVTPISCNHSQYHSLLELENTSYFNSYWDYSDSNELDNKTGLEDCKNACLRNCSCKAALFVDTQDYYPTRACLLLSEVFSLKDDDFVSSNLHIFLKVQNSPTKQSSPPIDFPRKKSRSGTIILGSSLGALFGICLLVGSCILVLKRKRELEELDDEFSVDKVPGMPTRFSYGDLKTATNDFNNKLGEGGFGSVFEGMLSDGTEVAVKCLAGLSQIKKSFLAEVQTIGSIHHFNLVRLIGFCAENSNRLLVYEYMSNGSLDRWIFKRHQELTLGWESRRKIIADIAKGLAYLHEGCRQKIYHLDVKPQNILLDENFEAKVSDFGLAKLIDKDQSRVVATLRGTPGYMAPEWLSSIITEKVDVYSFGVVVLEILCGRRNLDRSQPEEEMHLLGLFERKGEEGQLLDMVDKYNADMQLHGAEVVEMMKLAVWCLQSDYRRRPSMTVVVQVLEGLVSVQDDLDYNFINAPARRTIAAIGEDMDAVYDGTPLLASVLSGPR